MKQLGNHQAQGFAYIKNYQAQFATTNIKTSTLGFTPAIEDTSHAAKLYRSYIELKLKDLQIEAKQVLLRIMTQHPRSTYAMKARRILF